MVPYNPTDASDLPYQEMAIGPSPVSSDRCISLPLNQTVL